MAQRGIRETDAKRLLAVYLNDYTENKIEISDKIVLVDENTDFKALGRSHPFLLSSRLVVKPDMLIGKRGKNNLLLLDASFEEAADFIKQRIGKETTVSGTTGKLTHFLIEPYIEHTDEFYISIVTKRDSDSIYFSDKGGVDIEENWAHVSEIEVPVGTSLSREKIARELVHVAGENYIKNIADFMLALHKLFVDLDFSYLEINPFTLKDGKVVPLDMVVKLDDTASFRQKEKWSSVTFPTPFGTRLTKEEQYIKDMDENTGASLKLTILNSKGRIWTLVAGGGASVIYADTVADLGFSGELANYGEYSGNPKTDETYEYAKTVLELMTRTRHPEGKVLIIGGGIANFTDVAKTFTGIIKALEEYGTKLKQHDVKIYVRRGGPNYKEGLEKMKRIAGKLSLDMHVYGPETHITRIIPMALKK